MSELKKQRAITKGAVTRAITQLNSVLELNGTKDELESGLVTLDQTYTNFRQCHQAYHETLEDEDDIDASETYLSSVRRDVQDVRHTAVSQLHEVVSPDDHQQQSSSRQQVIAESNGDDIPPGSVPEDLLRQLISEIRDLRRNTDSQSHQIQQLKCTLEPRLQHPSGRASVLADFTPTETLNATSRPVSTHNDEYQSLPPAVNESSLSQLLELSRRQHQVQIDSLHLPPADLLRFDGDPLKYWQFYRLFTSLVDKETVPTAEKLTRLHQFTTGQAREAITCCLYNPDSTAGYSDAMSTLKRRFGNPYTISQAWIDKVLRYKDIRDNRQLRAFADTLRSCRDTLRSMKCEEEISGGRNLLRIVEKLPLDMKRKWLTKNYEITQSGGRPRLDDVVRMVEIEAEKRVDPIFGNLLNSGNPTLPSSNQSRPLQPEKKRQSFSTSSSVSKPKSAHAQMTTNLKCLKCGAEHYLNQCQSFRGLTVDERLTFVRSQKLCQNCFMKGHSSNDCSRTWICKVSGCGLKHNSWLHSALVASTTNNSTNNQSTNNQTTNLTTQINQATNAECPTTSQQHIQSNAVHNNQQPQRKIALPIIPVMVYDIRGLFSMRVLALLDNGSNGTFCSEKLVKQLQLEPRKTTIKLSTMENANLVVETSSVDIRVEDHTKTQTFTIKGVLTRERLNISLDSLMSNDEVPAWTHLAEINCLPEVRDGDEVHLLIGLDQPDILAPREICRGNPGEPYAVLTGLGWTLNGPTSHGISTVSSNFLHHDLQEAVERFWRLDEPSYLNHSGMSVTDKLVLSTWENKTYRDGSHYTVPIPFKRDPLNLPNNFTVAKHRLDLLGKRLKKDSDLHLKYSEGIQDNIRKGYAEEVSETDRTRDDGCVWYLPHHAVTNPRKPGKIRIVFDCAARYQGSSLNDHINQGPDLTNKLLGVLLRFRQEPVALSADIESMFCQVKVPPQHRDVLRFLWWDENDPDKVPKFYRMTTHLFGGVWSPSAASFALQKVTEDYSDFPPEVINTVKNDFYVDDCLKSVPTEDDAIALANGLRSLLAKGGFKLTKWLSNSKKVMKSIPLENWANSLHELNLDHDDLPYDRTLGVLWNVERDVFTIEVKVIDKPTTKRSILSITSSIYDPLGFVGPFVLRAKMIFQQLCRLRIGWDDAVPKDLETQWRRWLTDLPLLSNFSVPRCLKPTTQDKSAIQIHHFCDASETAYGAVSYLTIGGESRFVIAKSRLAPIKSTTIPRLELMSAVVATELDQYVKRHLHIGIQETFFWTDSMIVLHYINNTESRFQTFISNRITRIHERSEPGQWKHVDSSNNPADLVSRGMSAKEILNNNTWLSGPAFLKFGEERWPLQPVLGGLPDLAEIKVSKEVYLVNTGEQAVPSTTNRLFLRYSSWHRLKRAIVLILRLKAILRKRIDTPLGNPITVHELRSAEAAVIDYVQQSVYTSWNKKSSSLRRLKPFKDEDDVLRVGGRLVNAYIPYQARHPAIIPSDHHVTGLIINHFHLRYGHAGAERVLAEIRQRFWIVKGRSAVTRALRSCITCRKWRASPQEQQMAALHNSRVTPNLPPFTKVGVDYFGPFMVKRGRTELKRYGCVFTCLTTRAVHLEVSFTLDTNSFINALQRFIARRGSPDEIRSDNGTNFVGARRELRQAINEWNQQQISNHLLQSEIAWIFNPPGASHMGGVWERQIRTIRSVLNKLMVQQSLDDESLPTLFCCVEAIINGRPITKLSDDPTDLLPLTPNHLLLLRAGPTAPPGPFVHQDLHRRRWRQVQYLADLFWTRWLKEYLPALQETQKWTSRRRNMQPGDLVLLLNETTPRNQWPLGLITQVYPGPDELVRVVDVKTQTRTYTRPVTKLCLLEANLVDV